MAFINYISLLSTLIIFCFQCLDFCTAIDTINSSHHIKDPETITSNDGVFTLGFFSPENSANRYVGIWYVSKSTVIWVANRDQPLNDSSGSFTISNDGNLVVLNGQKHVMWSSKVSNISTNSSSKLTDSGKLDLLDSTGKKVWESFEHPTDTLMPNMRLSNNERTGEKVEITAWKSPSDPSSGNFTTTIERETIPEIFIRNEETHPYWRSGPWNSRVFLGIPDMKSSYLNGFSVNAQQDGTFYLSYAFANESLLTLIALNWEGKLQLKLWDYEEKEWKLDWESQVSECDVYGKCGVFGSCNVQSSPVCSCLRGYEPKIPEEWNRKNWTSGCVRKEELKCERLKNGSEAAGQEDQFLKLQKMKVPDFAERLDVQEEQCGTLCLQNCSCLAYAYDAGISCLHWGGSLIDLQQFTDAGVDLYIRLANSEFQLSNADKQTDKRRNRLIIGITVATGAIILVICVCLGSYRYRSKKGAANSSARRRKRKGLLLFNQGEASAENISSSLTGVGDLSQVELQDSLLFDTETLVIATNNFHFSNKLGQGGFGPVYKGKLKDGKEIAVKKLSSVSGQGLVEFMNEVTLISKLQHRNLVRLLGCCREDEKMLIYEFMPNTSLDSFIFDPPENKFLNWRKRFNIIEGIARGLLYLHRDSRLRIIHRDLKASNILLDEELNPKISDFGLARIFGGHGDQSNTTRVVGTYGYMSPEYAMQGLFSEKSDVFSFGVLLLEIVSGRKNSSFYKNEESLSLLGFAWKLWNDNNVVPLIDVGIHGPDHEKDILRCVHIGLLCVQESARDRPAMAVVISMLNSEIINLPLPKQPAFTTRENILPMSSEEHHGSFSNNSVSITEMQGR